MAPIALHYHTYHVHVKNYRPNSAWPVSLLLYLTAPLSAQPQPTSHPPTPPHPTPAPPPTLWLQPGTSWMSPSAPATLHAGWPWSGIRCGGRLGGRAMVGNKVRGQGCTLSINACYMAMQKIYAIYVCSDVCSIAMLLLGPTCVDGL